MTIPVKILCPSGHLSFTPFEQESFNKGCEMKPDFIISDAGSSDMGPRPLGADLHVSLANWQYQDLEAMLLASRRLNIPMIVGSASDTGTNRGVKQFVDIILDIAKKKDLSSFKLAAIYSEVPIEILKSMILDGAQIEGLNGRPNADLEIMERTDRVVAVMNAEPFRQALRNGADVIIAGRSSDCALFAAPLLEKGHSKAISYFTGKLMECASFCATPYMAKESIMGRIEKESVYITALHEDQRCTPSSVAGHAMYERINPYHEHVAGGYVDMSECSYEQWNENTTCASGAKFVESSKIKIKLEGSGKIGERRIALIGVRDPETTVRIEQAIEWSRSKLMERFGPSGEAYEVFFHKYGKNGVMQNMELASPSTPHEIGIVVEVVAPTGEFATEVCAMASRNIFYARLPDVKGTAGAAALLSDEILIGEPGYEWTLNHVIEITNSMDLCKIEYINVNNNEN